MEMFVDNKEENGTFVTDFVDVRKWQVGVFGRRIPIDRSNDKSRDMFDVLLPITQKDVLFKGDPFFDIVEVLLSRMGPFKNLAGINFRDRGKCRLNFLIFKRILTIYCISINISRVTSKIRFSGYKLSRVELKMRFRERQKNSRNRKSLYPRNFIPIKYWIVSFFCSICFNFFKCSNFDK